MGIDRELLHGAAKQDRKSEHLLYKACYSLLLSVTTRYFINEEDRVVAMNESFFKALNALPDFLKDQNPDAFVPWIRRITINTSIDMIRAQKRRKEEYTETIPEGWTSAAAENLEVDAEQLQRLLNKLPDMQRTVINMFAVDGFNHQEIADRLGITPENSRYHLSTARKTLTGWLNAMVKHIKTLVW